MSVPPTHRVGFADSDSIASIAYSPDSKEIFVALNVETISVWRVFLNEWPYTVGAISLLIVVINLFMLRRVLARPRKKGRTYCRKCNHEISDTAIPCSECGVSLDSRRALIMGKSFRRRTAPIFFVLAFASIGYGVLWITPNSIYAPMWGWFNWWSDGSLKLAQRHNISWITKHLEMVTRIAVIDVASGSRVRDLGTFTGTFHWHEDMKILPSSDGNHLFIPDRSTDLVALDTTTGSIWRRLRLDGTSLINQICGVAANGIAVYAAFHDIPANRVSLVRWDVVNDDHRVVKVVPGGFIASYATPECAPRFYLVPRPSSAVFLQIPPSGEVLDHLVRGPGPESRVEWFDESTPDQTSGLNVDIDFDCDPMPLGEPGGMGIKLFNSGLQILDIRSGDLDTLIENSRFLLDRPFSESPAQRIVFGHKAGKGIVVFDMVTKQLLTSTVLPVLQMSDVCVAIVPAPDLTSMAANAFHSAAGSQPGRGQYIHELLIYDLTPYPKLRELEFGTTEEPAQPSP